jgi:hypothetical protein
MINYEKPYRNLKVLTDKKIYFLGDKVPKEGYMECVNIYLVRELDPDATLFDYTTTNSLGIDSKYMFVSEHARKVFSKNRNIVRTQTVEACTSYHCLMEVLPDNIKEIDNPEPATTSPQPNNVDSQVNEEK